MAGSGLFTDERGLQTEVVGTKKPRLPAGSSVIGRRKAWYLQLVQVQTQNAVFGTFQVVRALVAMRNLDGDKSGLAISAQGHAVRDAQGR